jgi:hypothetical protein
MSQINEHERKHRREQIGIQDYAGIHGYANAVDGFHAEENIETEGH